MRRSQRVKAIKDITRGMAYNVQGPTANIVLVPRGTIGKVIDIHEVGIYDVAFVNGERWWVNDKNISVV